jgi:tetratricopeptide (TPR) repeat protein
VKRPHSFPPPPSGRGSSEGERGRTALVAAALCLLVAAVFWRAGGFGFVDLDDPRYVLENPQVRAGLTWSGFRWAFSATWAANWHPLTWLSLMLDVEVFGLDPGWMHRVNVLWHCADTVLLFLVLRSATGALWRPALVAALFGVHPLHVESVAWIAERKDVLSAFFWLLATAGWVSYARRPSTGRYLLVAGAMALGLLAKPMVVTLPVALLLLDVWPLGRADPALPWRSWAPRLVLEKLPLLGLSLAASAVAVLAQGGAGAVAAAARLPLATRLANAVVAYAWYLWKTIWPVSLAAFYPHPGMSPGGIPAWKVACAALLLAGVSTLVLWKSRRRPWLAVGWGWYLVTLLPVIGLVQVGRQGMADRYSYLPHIGIFIAVVWSLPVAAAPGRRAALAAAAVAAVLSLAATARTQAESWRDSLSLFSHAAALDRDNWLAWGALGVWHFDRGRRDEALRAFLETVRSAPWNADGWANVAACHAAEGRWGEAAEALERAAALAPGDEDHLARLAVAAHRAGRPGRAAEVVEQLRRRSPQRALEVERDLRKREPGR